MMCHRCQATLRSKKHSGFAWSGLVRPYRRRYCSPCRAERILARRSRVLPLWLGLASCSAMGMLFEGTRVLGWVLGNLLLFQLPTVARIMPLHELGHAVGGWLAGLREAGEYEHASVPGGSPLRSTGC